MKKRLLTLLLCVVIFVGIFPTSAFAATEAATDAATDTATDTATDAMNTEDIVILYENDVHCAVEGYSKLFALKKNLQKTYANVGVVSSGDYVQGSTFGVIARGENVVKLMNLVGYDALTLGNHEFDYRLPRLNELVEMMNTKPVCCNFEKIGDSKPYFEPYSIVEYGQTKVAYVGVTTPSTLSSSSPAQFRDENGDYAYTFHPKDLYETVQKSVDSALAAGADYIVALTHVGDKEVIHNVEELIAKTKGIDVVLDAHSHSVIEGKMIKNSAGEDVILTSTGTKFEHIGKLTIADGKFTTELIKTETITDTDPETDALIEEIIEKQEEYGGREVGVSNFDLITHDENGNRIVRLMETNLGDLCADAFRSCMDADIGFCNGGGIREPIKAGKITFNDLLSVLQYNNTIVHVEVSGQFIKNMLELTLDDLPNECGSFPHVSGIKFSVNTSIDTSVIIDENENFVKIDGPYRVYGLEILNRETNKYEPIDLEKNYTLAISNYYALEYGGGMTMFEGVKILKNDGTLDVEALERYITEELGGVIGEQYATVQKNITFTEGEITESESDESESEWSDPSAPATEAPATEGTEKVTEDKEDDESESEWSDPSAPTPDLPEPSAPATEAPATEGTEKGSEDKEDEGCGSVVAISALSLVGIIGTALLLKKKKD